MFNKRQEAPEGQATPKSLLETPLINFRGDHWCIGDAIEGTQIFGGTGSGKTSGSGKELALSFLSKGFGGLILTYSEDDTKLWLDYAAKEGRANDVVLFGEGHPARFDFLRYESEMKRGDTENIVQLFMTVMEIAERGKKRNSSDSYWEDTAKQLLRNSVDLLKFAGEEVSLRNIHKLVLSAPRMEEELHISGEERADSYFLSCIDKTEDVLKEKLAEGTLHPSLNRDVMITSDFWSKFFPNLEDRTRSIIESVFTSMADLLLRGLLGELFSGAVTFRPEDCYEGKLIILDLPYTKHRYVGQLAQVLFKYVWQRAVSARDIKKHPLPIFLWADESQYFLTSYDAEFQTTARHARVATVYLTQNISNYYAMMGADERARSFTHSLLGNLQTKIFHQNSDSVTNDWAAELFGRRWKQHLSVSSGYDAQSTQQAEKIGVGKRGHASASSQESFDWHVPPHWFSLLRKGGYKHDLKVDAYLLQGGRIWKKTGDIELKVTFSQK